MSNTDDRRAASDALHARVLAFVDAPSGAEPESFDALALALARFQAAHVPALAKLAAARGVDLDRAESADVIPAVPSDLLRVRRVAAHPPEEDTAVFRTSGTTMGARGEHPFRTTATYAHVALAWGKRMLFPDHDRMRVIVLAPPRADLPDSSLSFMFDLFARFLGGPATFHVAYRADGSAEIDRDELAHEINEARAANEITLVLATSFALVHLLDGPLRDLTLPKGSRVLQTGGFKGRSREVSPAELIARTAQTFGVPASHVVGEYGMTELSSQLYEGTLASAIGRFSGVSRHGLVHAPPWVRVTAAHPETLDPLPNGEVGIARVIDLANVDSAVAIQTADEVRVLPEGVELLGRAKGATPRGCSLAIDGALSSG